MSSAPSEVLLFPGSFSPMHVGHLALCSHIANTLTDEIGEVWLSVTPANPFKAQATLLPDDLRLRWAAYQVGKHPRLKLTKAEYDLPRPSYTIDTIHHLQELYPESRFSLLVGADTYPDLPRWHRGQELIEGYRVYLYPRPGYSTPALLATHHRLLAGVPLFDVSATRIRTLLSRDLPIPYLLNCDIDHPLYRELVDAVRLFSSPPQG